VTVGLGAALGGIVGALAALGVLWWWEGRQ